MFWADIPQGFQVLAESLVNAVQVLCTGQDDTSILRKAKGFSCRGLINRKEFHSTYVVVNSANIKTLEQGTSSGALAQPMAYANCIVVLGTYLLFLLSPWRDRS